MIRILLTFMLACGAAAAAAPAIDVRDFFRHSEVNDIELSPTGEYLAVTVPQDDRTLLAVLRTADKGIVAKWDYFKDVIPSQHWLSQRMDEIEKARHFIAHNRLLLPTEFNRLYMYIADWNRVIGL